MYRCWIATSLFCCLFPAAMSGQGKFSGYMFGDYYYNFDRDSAVSALSNVAADGGAKAYQAFQLRRVYFTYDNDISEKFASRFRLEADQISRTSDNKIGVFVKDACLRWKGVFEGSDLYFGIHPTPAFEISESAWGYRSLEKTILDLRGIVSSRDLGVALRGKIDDGGKFNYWVMVGNNSGNRPETDKYKRYYAMFQAKPTEKLQLTVYADYADRADVIDPYAVSPSDRAVSNGALTVSGFAGYREPDEFNIGIEVFLQSRSHGFNDPSAMELASLNASGISIFGSVSVQSDLDLVARYDYFDPNTSSKSKGDARNFVLVGAAWKVDPKVSIIPNFQIETYQSQPPARSIATSVTGRVTFYYVFL